MKMNLKTSVICFVIVAVAGAMTALFMQLNGKNADPGRTDSDANQAEQPAQPPQSSQPAQLGDGESANEAWLYNNPLLDNVADPGVLRASDGHYYVYATGMGLRVFSSPDLVHWKEEGQSLPPKEVSSWAKQDFWAPSVTEYKGKYYMFFSASAGKGTPKRLSVAVSDSPKGPFKHPEDHPVFSFGPDIDKFGAIDPYAFVDDDGKAYLYFTKTLHPVNGHPESDIYVVELNEDLKSYKGKPVQLVRPEQAWELDPDYNGKTRINEGSWLLKNKDRYYLMYSANCACNNGYAVGYATSRSPMGPFVKYENNPILHADYDGVSGTGHHSVVQSPDGSELWMVYHSRMKLQDNEKAGLGNPRQLNIDRMGFREDGTIYVNGPTLTKQVVPSGVADRKNIAADAKITVSSSKVGSEKSLIDGEIGMYARFAKYDWVPAKEDSSWVKLEWQEAREISTVLLYDSGDPQRAVASGKLQLDDGTTIAVAFPKEPGAVAIVELGGKKVKSMKFILDKGKADKEYGLSEIIVLGASGAKGEPSIGSKK